MFTIGVEGSLYLGAFAAAWVGFTFTDLSGTMLAPLAVLVAAVTGALWSAPPAALRAWLGVDEVVSTLMLNYVAILLTSYLVNEHFLAPGVANSMSPLVANQARLQPLLPAPNSRSRSLSRWRRRRSSPSFSAPHRPATTCVSPVSRPASRRPQGSGWRPLSSVPCSPPVCSAG